MHKKLTEQDIANIMGVNINGYTVEKARVKDGEFSDSNHYGIVLAVNEHGHHVTWQFHLADGWIPEVYWGHYHLENWETAIDDYNSRS